MDLDEAEIQVLVSVYGAERETAPADRESLEKGGERYSSFLEDWSEAFAGLAAKTMIEGDETGYRLTEEGRPLGRMYHRQRPDKYWYYFRDFYPAAHASRVHSRLCEGVYGKDLCQEGMVDMAALDDLLRHLDLGPGDHLLDLGCGAGGIAEYISDQTGCRVTGLDYSASAIAVANERTADKRSRLTFMVGDMNALELPAQSFDAAIALDSLYDSLWITDLAETLSWVAGALKPGGQIAISQLQVRGKDDPPDILEAGNTRLAQVLGKLNLAYEAHDHSSRNAAFWSNFKAVTTELFDDLEAEGNGFIVAELKENAAYFLSLIDAGTLARYLYHVRL